MEKVIIVILALLFLWKTFEAFVCERALKEFKKMALEHGWKISEDDAQKVSKSIFKRNL